MKVLIQLTVKEFEAGEFECPTCGYEFGSAWNTIPVPQDVIDFLASLPETTKTPAWI